MTETGRRDWLWVAFAREASLLYGCLVHSAELGAVIPDNEKRKTACFERTNVEIRQALLDSEEAQQIADAVRMRWTLDLSRQGGPSIALGGSRRRLADGFGRRSRPMETYAGADHAQLSDDAWSQALTFLKETIGVDFRRVPDRLGAFDIYDVPEADGGDPPIDFSVERERSTETITYPEQFVLSANRTADDDYAVHVELELGQEPVFSKLITVHPGEIAQVKAVPFDHYRMSVFHRTGMLVQFDEHSLMLHINFNISAMGPTLAIDDTLARSAQGLGPEIRDRASKVRTRSTTRSKIAAESDTAFEVHRTKMRALAHRLVPPSGSDRWFHRGIADEVGVIAHFNNLLDGARVSAGTIVDPYFGIDTLKRVISRLESLDVNLTVVTSLIETDPETNDPKADLLGELATVLRDLRGNGIPNAARRLRVLNLIDGPRQAFHDRYLLLTPHEGEREVYLLSNSLNRMAGKWPFCMSKLEGAAARDAALYIDGLANGRDISGSTQPTTTFQWPSDDAQ